MLASVAEDKLMLGMAVGKEGRGARRKGWWPHPQGPLSPRAGSGPAAWTCMLARRDSAMG